MNSANNGPSFLIGMVAGVPSFAYAVFNNESMTLIAGIAAGVIGLGWSIYRSSNDQRLEAILNRLDKAEEEAKGYRDGKVAVEMENARLNVELAAAMAKLKAGDPA